MKKIIKIVISACIIAILAAVIWLIAENRIMSSAPDCEAAALGYMHAAAETAFEAEAESENGKILRELSMSASENVSLTRWEKKGRNVKASLDYAVLDTELLQAEMLKQMPALLEEINDAAKFSSEVYDENYTYLPQITEKVFHDALKAVNSNDCLHFSTAYIDMHYSRGEWRIVNPEVLANIYTVDFDNTAAQLYEKLLPQLPFVPKHYTIDRAALAGPAPDQSKFGSTTDPAVIEKLIASPAAQMLINGQELSWNRDIELFPETEINYYLDETIFMLQWKEVTAKAVGTYAEVFIADASQLRRKIAGDSFGDMNFNYATNFAKQTNAVLAVGGDLYNHARACGVVVYGGEIYRFDPETCDTLYFDRNGDMLYSHRNEFSEQSEAEKLVAENGVDFSICFGPVLIENGADVTPDYYMWGEINDTYARSAIGQLGKLHYLTVNINCLIPNYYYLATLHDATDAMMAHGCYTAYALDGGQTAETIVNGVMINPVQFGQERMVSDIIYFASAVPEN